MGKFDVACSRVRKGFYRNIWAFVALGALAALNFLASFGYGVALVVAVLGAVGFFLYRRQTHVPIETRIADSQTAVEDLLAEEEKKAALRKQRAEKKKRKQQNMARQLEESGRRQLKKGGNQDDDDEDDEEFLRRHQAVREGKAMSKVGSGNSVDFGLFLHIFFAEPSEGVWSYPSQGAPAPAQGE